METTNKLHTSLDYNLVTNVETTTSQETKETNEVAVHDKNSLSQDLLTLSHDLQKVISGTNKIAKGLKVEACKVWHQVIFMGSEMLKRPEVKGLGKDTTNLCGQIIKTIRKTEPLALQRIGKFGLLGSSVGMLGNYAIPHNNYYPLIFGLSSGLFTASFFPLNKVKESKAEITPITTPEINSDEPKKKIATDNNPLFSQAPLKRATN